MTNMTEKYVLVSSTDEILEFRDYAPNVDQKLLAEGKPRQIILVDNPPVFNPDVEYLEKEYEIFDDRVVVNYNIADKPPEDITNLVTSKIQDIKDEARRRIYLHLLDHQQINAMAKGLEMLLTYGFPANWPKEQRDKIQHLMEKWKQIEAIRYRSDELEAELYALTDPKEISAFNPLEGWD